MTDVTKILSQIEQGDPDAALHDDCIAKEINVNEVLAVDEALEKLTGEPPEKAWAKESSVV